MAMLSRARVMSSSLFSKLAHHPPIHRAFSSSSSHTREMMNNNPMFSLDISSQMGSCMPISMMRIGTIIHNIEMNPGQGGKLVRARGGTRIHVQKGTRKFQGWHNENFTLRRKIFHCVEKIE